MDDAGFARAHLVGNSLGGYLALQLAARGRAESVVAFAPAGGWAPADGSSRAMLAMQASMCEQARAARAAGADAALLSRGAAGRHQADHDELRAHPSRAARAPDARGRAAASAEQLIAAALRAGFHVAAAGVRVPVRFVWGTEDALLPWPEAAWLFRGPSFARADWVELAGVGHCPQLDVPIEAGQLILDWTLERHPHRQRKARYEKMFPLWATEAHAPRRRARGVARRRGGVLRGGAARGRAHGVRARSPAFGPRASACSQRRCELFGERGVVDPTLEDVRRAAGVSVGALYHHFPDKAHLASALYVELTADFQDAFLAELRGTPEPRRASRPACAATCAGSARTAAAAALLLGERPAEDPALRERNRRFLGEVSAWWQTHVHYGVLRDLPVELIHALWLGPAQEYTRHWLAGRGRRLPASTAGVLAEAAWRSLEEER